MRMRHKTLGKSPLTLMIFANVWFVPLHDELCGWWFSCFSSRHTDIIEGEFIFPIYPCMLYRFSQE